MYEEKINKMNDSFKAYARILFFILMFFIGIFTGVKTIDNLNIEGIINTIYLFIGLFTSTIIIITYLKDE